jgi:single-strand DNA-binding protein
MASLNRVIIMGNLARDPELRYTPAGAPVTRLTVAVNRVYTSPEGERKEETSFIPVVVWGKQAESCSQYLSKGRLVLVDGRLQHRRWENAEGERRSTLEVVAQRVQFLGSPKEEIPTEEVGEEEEGVPF